MKSLMEISRTTRSESGFALIEVIVSAAVLAIVALAVLSGIDAANGASMREKGRAVAASLAEKDQERLRAMAINLVAAPPQQDPVTVDGVTYTIESKAEWITDDIGGAPACGDESDQVEYLHITSIVTSAVVGHRIPPVTVDSLVAPTAAKAESQGTLGVKVVDRTGQVGMNGITVRVSSSAYTPPSQVTNADGCVVFNAMPVGSYTVTLDELGYLDRAANQHSETTQSVVAKKVSFATMTYDRATEAQVSVTTHPPNRPWSAGDVQPSKARAVSATNGANVGMLTTAQSVPAASLVEVGGLFPFTEASYQFFTGLCKYASPDTYKPANTNYFSQTNLAATLWSNPAALSQPVGVRQPPFNIRIDRNRNGDTFTGDTAFNVYAKLQKPASASTDTCVETRFDLATMTWPGGPWGAAPGGQTTHWVSQPGSFDPGMPFGIYTICLRDTTVANRYARASSSYDNTLQNGRAPTLTIDAQALGSWGNTNPCA